MVAICLGSMYIDILNALGISDARRGLILADIKIRKSTGSGNWKRTEHQHHTDRHGDQANSSTLFHHKSPSFIKASQAE